MQTETFVLFLICECKVTTIFCFSKIFCKKKMMKFAFFWFGRSLNGLIWAVCSAGWRKIADFVMWLKCV